MNKLGNLLKQLRGYNSLRTISAKTDGKISFGYLGLLEKGINPSTNQPVKPTPEVLKILSEVYNYPYEHLMYLAGYLDNFEGYSDKNTTIIEDKVEIFSAEELYNYFIKMPQEEKLKFMSMIIK